MNATRPDLFALAEQRLAWTDQRQALLARNIANVSLPGYQARDMQPFARMLQDAANLLPARTQAGHLAGTAGASQSGVLMQPKARSPDGNTVALDEQLTRVADTETTQSMVTSIYKKYLGMFRMALGQ